MALFEKSMLVVHYDANDINIMDSVFELHLKGDNPKKKYWRKFENWIIFWFSCKKKKKEIQGI